MKKTVSILLTIAMLAVMIPTLAVSAAAPTAWDGAAYDLSWATQLVTSSGETADVTIDNVKYTTIKPSATEPFILEDAADLAGLAKLVNGKQNGDKGILTDCTFYITKDIDLGSKNWTPIGNTFNNRFGGNLIGSKGDQTGKGGAITIKNMVIVDTSNTNNAGIGFVGTQQGGSIKNLIIDNNSSVTANAFRIGSFVGQFNAGTLENLVSYATLTIKTGFTDDAASGKGYTYWDVVGGIAGCVHGGITANNCMFGGTISNAGNVSGGIVGTVETSATFNDCVVISSSITHGGGGAHYGNGGIVGYARNTVSVNRCYVSAVQTSNNKAVIGGVIGLATDGKVYSITDTQFDGICVGTGSQRGAFIGRLNGNGATLNLTRCLNTGMSVYNDNLNKGRSFSWIGLIYNVGTLKINIKNCYGTSNIPYAATAESANATYNIDIDGQKTNKTGITHGSSALGIAELRDLRPTVVSYAQFKGANATQNMPALFATDANGAWTIREGMYPVPTKAASAAPTTYGKADMSWFNATDFTSTFEIDSYNDLLGLSRIAEACGTNRTGTSAGSLFGDYKFKVSRVLSKYITADLFTASVVTTLNTKLTGTLDSENVVALYAQTSTELSGGTYNVRIVAEIKGMDWTAAGFDFMLSYKDTNGNVVASNIATVENIDKCYTSLFATEADDETAITAPSGHYYVVFVLSDVEATNGNVTIDAVAKLSDNNGDVFGSTGRFTFDSTGKLITK